MVFHILVLMFSLPQIPILFLTKPFSFKNSGLVIANDMIQENEFRSIIFGKNIVIQENPKETIEKLLPAVREFYKVDWSR